MTEESLLRETLAQYFVESLNIVDGFAVIDRFPKQVLIQVGNRVAVWIHPSRIREETRKARCGCRRQRDADTRLNDRVATKADATVQAEFDTIEGMCDRFD